MSQSILDIGRSSVSSRMTLLMIRATATRSFQFPSNPMKRHRRSFHQQQQLTRTDESQYHNHSSVNSTIISFRSNRTLFLQHSSLYPTQPSVRRCLLSTGATSSSTPGSSFFSSPLNWWRDRQEVNELEKYKQRIAAMAEKEAWLIGDAIQEIDESLNTWKAKVPGASSMNEIKVAKEMLKSLNGLAKVVGKSANEESLAKMTHKEKLEAAVNGEMTLESVNRLIDQFCTMSLMHRTLRHRKVNNKTLPTTPEAITALMQSEAPKLMSKDKKLKMGKDQAKRMLKRKY